MVETRDLRENTTDRSDAPRSGAADRGEGHREDSRGAKGGAADRTERRTDDKGYSHERSTDKNGERRDTWSKEQSDGQYSRTTTWTDKNGDVTRVTSESQYRTSDGKLHHDATDSRGSVDVRGTKWTEGSTTYTDITYKTEKGNTHYKSESQTDSKGTTHTRHERTHTDLAGRTSTEVWFTDEKAKSGKGSDSHSSSGKGSDDAHKSDKSGSGSHDGTSKKP